MMLVRRMSLKRPPQYQSPTKKMIPPTANPAATMSGEKPPTRIWSSKRGSGVRTSWKRVCDVYRPSAALIAIHVGASSQT